MLPTLQEDEIAKLADIESISDLLPDNLSLTSLRYKGKYDAWIKEQINPIFSRFFS